MIKIGIVSDIHAEFWGAKVRPQYIAHVREQLRGADLVLMAGDIDIGAASIRTASEIVPDRPVCLVAGNHEFYNGCYEDVLDEMHAASKHSNVKFLHRRTYYAWFGDTYVRVIGTTLWTDFHLYGTPVISTLDASLLSDFMCIKTQGRRLKPVDTAVWHSHERDFLVAELESEFDGLTIVLTHHAPVSFANKPRFVNDPMSPCFASRLEDVVLRDDVALVVWGHTHHSMDMTVENTRLFSNQIGYLSGHLRSETGDFGTVILLGNDTQTVEGETPLV